MRKEMKVLGLGRVTPQKLEQLLSIGSNMAREPFKKQAPSLFVNES